MMAEDKDTKAAADDAPAKAEKKPAAAKKPAAKKPAAKKAADKPKADKAAAEATTPEERAAAAASAERAAMKAGDVESRPVRAVAKYLRFSAQKGRLVVDQIRGRRVGEAAVILQHMTRGASVEVFKVLKSAAANAQNNHGMDISDLYVAAAYVDEGPTFKRWKPRARGRVDRINKRTCHVTIILDVVKDDTVLVGSTRGTTESRSESRAKRVAASKEAGAKKGAARKDTTKPKAERKPAADAPAKKDQDAGAEVAAAAESTTTAAADEAAGDETTGSES